MKGLCLSLLFLFISIFSIAQSAKPKIGPRGNWVTDVGFDKSAMPDEGDGGSYYYLLIDEQENILLQEDYIHYAYKILTSEGVQEMSDLSFDFDPTYNELILHSVVVHRQKESINRLTKDIRTIQREQSMDRYMYDGSLTAIINLQDVRVGDVIEYSFTRKGYNPIYKGHFTEKIYFNYQTAYESRVQRIIIPKVTSVIVKRNNGSPEAKIENLQDKVIYSWSVGKTKGLLMDNHVPDWYDPYQFVSISDLKDWSEVAKWASEVFKLSETDKLYVKNKIFPTFKTDSLEEFIVLATRFVQDEVRYLGFEAGLNSHKPHKPKEVFENRFGDCKDKSLLLATLLEVKGIEARPILVNTYKSDKMEDQVPSMHAFNHCVVEFKLNDKMVFIDPTINNQGGEISSNYFPYRGKGLIVDEKTTDFVEFPALQPSIITEIQNFDVVSIGGEVMLESSTTYTGAEADYQRTEFLKNNIDEIQKNYLTFYGNLFPDIEKFKRIEGRDNRSNNIFTVTEKYKIPTFWKPHQTKTGVVYAEIYPQSLHTYFSVTKTNQRTAPYRLNYPVDYYHTIHIKVPEEWPVEPQDVAILNDYYTYEYQVSYRDREITLFTHYETKKPFVPVEGFEKLVADHEKMMDNLTFSISYNQAIAKGSANIWPGLIMTTLAVVFSLWFIYHLYHRYDPKPYFDTSPEPIGGWLILVAFGITLTPLRFLFDFIKDPNLLMSNQWFPMIFNGRPGAGIYILIENVFNILLLFFVSIVAVMFYQRRSSVPRLISIFYAVSCAGTILDTSIAYFITGDNITATQYGDIFQKIIMASIWIPYFQMSSRVKETFLITLNDYDDKPAEEPTP